jgi:multisubunit Na+/H+ antiporter MnhB subunit
MKGPQSFIFRTMVRVAFFIINLLALYLLLRGHNYPGGGFIGGLAAAISLVLLSLALGLEEMHRVLRFDPVRVAAAGLFLAAFTGLLPLLAGRPFLEHFHAHFNHVPFLGELHIGTPLLFDVGVFLVVVGVTTKLIFVFAKSTAGLRALVQDEEIRYSSPRETPIESDWSAPEADAPDTKEGPHAT